VFVKLDSAFIKVEGNDTAVMVAIFNKGAVALMFAESRRRTGSNIHPSPKQFSREHARTAKPSLEQEEKDAQPN
jgi:hypothetical protein